METGVFIRAEINGKWEAVDIGDSRMPDSVVASWLRSRGGKNVWAEKIVMVLLGRLQVSVAD